MKSIVFIGGKDEENSVYAEKSIDDIIERLLGMKLYKGLSLVISSESGIPIPPTIMVMQKTARIENIIAEMFDLPLMVRMDYSVRPREKPIGGLPLRTDIAIRDIIEFLFSIKCYPMFHPYYDRSKNIYSTNIMVEASNYVTYIELVGQGFDAGDLRLGKTIPHERIEYDLMEMSIIKRDIISNELYIKDREIRINTLEQLNELTEYANKNGKLVQGSSINNKNVNKNNSGKKEILPEKYQTIPIPELHRIGEYARIIKSKCLRRLPSSSRYVASMSKVAESGWLLWDIYGEWYQR